MPTQKNVRISTTGNVPTSALSPEERAVRQWDFFHANLIVSQGRMFILACVALIIGVGAITALIMLLPLKQLVPLRVNVNETTGEVRTVGIDSKAKWQPSEANLRFFLGRWSSYTIGIDPNKKITEQQLKWSFGLCRGVAVNQFKDFIKTTGPVQRVDQDTSLSREVKILAIQQVTSDTYLVRLQTIERSNSGVSKPIRFQMTIHFVLDPPAPDDNDAIYNNPIGIQITNFQLTQEAN